MPEPSHESPIQFGQESPPEAVGMSAARVARVAALFEQQVREGLHPGAQLVVLRHGRVVLDRVAGHAGDRGRTPVHAATPFLTFSVTKPFAAICLHRLIEEGRVELDAPIADYWPEFGRGGKERAMIRHALLHQVGIPMRGLRLQVLLWPSWERVTRNVAALPAEWEPGTRTAYHLVNFGFIVGEVVRRVSGFPIELFLRQHFLNPLGMRGSWLGLPPARWAETPRLSYDHAEHRHATWLFNLRVVRSAVLPAATLHSNARELATFYQMLLEGGRYAGRRFLQPGTIEAATALGYEGYDGTIQRPVRWGHGFQLGGSDPERGIAPEGALMGHGSSARTFGHFGNATSMTWADPEARLVVAFTCNRLLGENRQRQRWRALSDAIWDAIVE